MGSGRARFFVRAVVAGSSLALAPLLTAIVALGQPVAAASPTPEPRLTVSWPSAVEGDAGDVVMTFIAALDRPAEVAVSFDWTTSGIYGATADVDYASISGSTTIPVGQQTASIDVDVHGDLDDEGNGEYLGLHVTGLTGATGDFEGELDAFGFIADDDLTPIPEPRLTVSLPSVVEGDVGDVHMTFIAALDRPTDVAVTFDWTTSGIYQAAPGIDYQSNSGSSTIPVGEQTAAIDVIVHGDLDDEGDGEYLGLRLTGLTGATGDQGEIDAYGLIFDDDATPIPQPRITVSLPSVIEGDTGNVQLRFAVVLDRPAAGAVTVHFATRDGAATVADGDYDQQDGTLTIADGAQAAEVSVTVHGDTNPELSHEYLFLDLSDPVGADFGIGSTTSTSYGWIYEDDNPSLTAPPNPTLTPIASSIIEGDSGTRTMHLPVVLDRTLVGPVTVHASAVASPLDYDTVNTTVTMPSGQLIGFVDITVHGDTLDEGEQESIFITLDALTGGAEFSGGGGSLSGYYATIYDDDITPPSAPTLTPFVGSIVEGDSGTRTMHLPVVLDRTLLGPVTVHATASGVPLSYDAVDAIVTIPAGQVVGFVDITVHGDTLDENEYEQVLVEFDTLTGGAEFSGGGGSVRGGYGTIYDDDITPPPTPILTPLGGSIIEGDSGTVTMRLPVVLDRRTPGPVTVHASAVDDASVFDPRDFDDVDTTVTIPAGQLVGFVDITVYGDTLDENAYEQFFVTLDTLTGGVEFSGGGPSSSGSYGTIYDDDDPGPGHVHFEAFESAASEPDSTAIVRVIRDAGWNGPVTAQVSVTGGTATAGEDYSPIGAVTVSWADGEIGPQDVEIPLIDDAISEGEETIDLELTNVTGGATAVSPTTTTVRIADDEEPLLPIVDAGPDLNADEGEVIDLAGSVTNPPPDIEWSVTSGPATGICWFGNAFMASTTVYCTDNGTWTLTLTATDSVHDPVSDSMDLTVRNVAPSVTITEPVADATFLPDEEVSVSATIQDDGSSDTFVVCTIDFGDGTVVPGLISGNTCTGSHPYGAIGDPRIEVTVTDDDLDFGSSVVDIHIANPVPTATIDDVTNDEGNAGTTDYTFAVGLSAASASQVVVSWRIDDGTATTADGDYVDGFGQLTFAPGDLTKPVVVKINGDTKVEPDETFDVVITSGDATIVDATGTGKIVNDDVNTPPVLSPIGNQTVQTGAVLVVPLAARDDNGDSLHFTATGLPGFAELTDNGGGTGFLTLSPLAADVGPHPGVDVNVSDGLASAHETFTITVAAPGNHRPYAINDSGATHGTGPVAIAVLANDTDIDGDNLTIDGFDPHGGQVLCGGGTCTYTPATGLTGTDYFTYTVSDGRGGLATATVTVRVYDNDPPVAHDDIGSARRGGGSTSIDVIRNDDDPEGDSLSAKAQDVETADGRWVCGGTCAYTAPDVSPTGSFPFEAVFTYEVDDGHGGSASASVRITVTQNRPPHAEDDTAIGHGTGPVIIPVTANDTDPDLDGLRVVEITGLTGHGTVLCDSSCSYTPPAGPLTYPFVATFRYTVDDGFGATASADVTVTMYMNLSPLARPDGMTAPGVDPGYEAIGVVAPLVNDTDADGDPLMISSWTQPAHGSVVCVPPVPGLPWRCLYSADGGYVGPDSYTYTISDSHGVPPPADNGFSTATITVKVTANRTPTANSDAGLAHGASALNLRVLANDEDPDDDALSVVRHTDPDVGTVDCSGDCVYHPPTAWAGPYPLQHFDYTVADGRGGESTASVTIRLIENLGPVAVADRASARFGDLAEIAVLSNDWDPEGDQLTVNLRTPATHGVATCGVGSCSYDAPAGFFGEDEFTYLITDESGETAWATVTVTVVQNRPPLTADDHVTVALGTHPRFDPTLNDSDPDDDRVRLIDWTPPGVGKVLCENGCLYTPDPSTTVPYSTTFQYTITDDRGGYRTGTVTVDVIANRPPTAADDSLHVWEHETTWSQVVGNDVDPENDVLTIVANTPAAHGIVDCTKAPSGSSATPRHWCSYTLDAGYTGPWPLADAFTYTIRDQLARESTATVTVTIDKNHAPVANDDELTTHAGHPVPANVAGNDIDDDGDTLTVVAFTSPNFGCGQGGCVYTPPAPPASGYPFEETFTYDVSDGHGHVATATVHVTVNANRGPAATDDNITIRTGREALFDVLANDGDPDGDPIAILSATDALHGTVACPSETFGKAPRCTYVSNTGYIGPDTFSYTIADPLGESATATVNITVTSGNRPVDAIDDDLTIFNTSPTNVDVLANDQDPDLNALRIVDYDPAPGSFTTKGGRVYCSSTPGGFCRYTPPQPYFGPFPLDDSFTYVATDGFGATDQATVQVHLVNRRPIAGPDTARAHGPVAEPIPFLANDSDPDGDAIVGLVVDLTDTKGTATCSLTTGFCSYIPKDGVFEPDVFHYTITDDRGASATTTITVDVFADGAPIARPDTVDLRGSRSPTPINVRANDTDPDADYLSVVPASFTTGKGGTVECDPEGCVYTPAAASTGIDTFTYTIDDGHGLTASAEVSVGIDVTVVTASLQSAPNPSKYLEAVEFRATVVAPGGGAPTGMVAFREGATLLGSAPVSGGVATLTLSTLSPGNHSINATFTGSGSFAGSTATSAAILHVVGKVGPTVVLVSSKDPSAVGAPVTFTATVTPPAGLTATPTGLVTFLEGPTTLGTEALVSGDATFTTSALPAGVHALTARYDGDSSYAGATSAPLSQHVGTPTAVDDTIQINEDAAATTIRVLDNDTDPDGTAGLSVASIGSPILGDVTIELDGTFTYTPHANEHGTDTFSYTITDGGQSSTANVTVAILPVADAPIADDQTVTPSIVQGTSTTITLSGSDVDSPALTFAIATGPTQGTLGALGAPSCTPDGAGTTCTATVVYTANADGSGGDSFTFTVSDGGLTSAPAGTVTLEVTGPVPVNQAPSFTKGADQTVDEDAGAQSVPGWATSISAGPAGESGQTVDFVVSNDNNALFAVPPAVAGNGTLTYTAAANANGSATATIHAHDDGGTANGGVNISPDQTFTITIIPINDAPSFTKGADQTVAEDAGAQTVVAWATAISAGPANESTQTVNFVVSNDNNGLFSDQPAISPSGTLTYSPVSNANGSATVTVAIHDNGGTANAGLDTSASQTFTVTVSSVNDAPAFTKGANQAVLEDAAAQTVTGWATAISPGPSAESGQTVTFEIVSNTNAALFSAGPAVSPGGILTYTPATNANGIATITIHLRDNGGTANGGVDVSPDQSFTITVNAVNDAPSFTKGANQTVVEDAGAQTVPGWATAISAGPANEVGQTVNFEIVTNTNTALFSAGPAIGPSGTLTYTPATNANGTATITIRLRDSGGVANGGVNVSPNQAFTITVSPVNDPPTAAAGADQSINEGTSASLRGTATDPDGRIVSYTWTQGARSFSGANVSIPFGDDGTFTVTFTACDNGSPSLCATDTVVITVRNLDPTGKIGTEPSGAQRVNTTLAYTRGNFAQVTLRVIAADVPADPLTYLWDFNDGSSPRLGPATMDWAYPLGQFDPIVTVLDDDGGSRLVRFHRVTVMAIGGCNGVSSELIAARLFDWWGGGTAVTVSRDTVLWYQRGADEGPVTPRYVFQAGQITHTRGAGVGAYGPMLQSGCVTNKNPTTRYIGIQTPSSLYTDTYLPEERLIKNPKG